MGEIAHLDTAGTAVAQRTPQQQLMARIREDDFREQIALALPPTVTVDRFVRVALTALMEKPEIATAEPTSIFAAFLRCAQLGLFPDGREAAINVYRTKAKDAGGRETWIEKAQCLEMIHGYVKIAADHGWTLTARVVYAADDFEYEEGLEPRLRHKPAPPATDRGDRVGVYAIATKRGEQPMFRVLSPTDVARAKKSAKTDKIWNEHTDRMWEKTAGKLLFKSLPLGNLDERVRRLLETADTEPEDAAAMLYGPDARTAFAARELGPATPAAGEAPGDDPPPSGTGAAVGQQDAAADSTPEAPPPSASGGTDDATAAASPGSDVDDIPFGESDGDDEPVLGAPAQLPEEIVAAAGAYVVPRGNPYDDPDKPGAKGLTLAQIDARDGAEAWFQAALSRAPGYWPEDFAGALRVFVQARRPDLVAA